MSNKSLEGLPQDPKARAIQEIRTLLRGAGFSQSTQDDVNGILEQSIKPRTKPRTVSSVYLSGVFKGIPKEWGLYISKQRTNRYHDFEIATMIRKHIENGETPD